MNLLRSTRESSGIRVITSVVLALTSLLLMAAAPPQRKVSVVDISNPRTEEWPAETKAAFARIPIQDRGRVKPLSTFAGFRMLNMNGKRSYKIPAGTKLPTVGEKGETLDPVAWMLDVMLFREQARHYEIFVVTDDKVLERIGVKVEGRKKRDRYSYLQLRPGRAKLQEEAMRVQSLERSQRTRIETQMLELHVKLLEYDRIELTFETLQTTLGPNPSERLLTLFPGGTDGASVPVGTVLSEWDTVSEWMTSATTEAQGDAVRDELAGVAIGVDAALSQAPYLLAMVPPADPGQEVWRSAGEVILDVFKGPEEGGKPVQSSELALLDSYATIWNARGDVTAASAAILAAQKVGQQAAEARGEFRTIPLEISYYKGKYFIRALVAFLLAFVLIAVSWMLPGSKWLPRGVWALSLLGLGMTVAGVTTRCLLLSRPPVATLYETILFITAIAVAVCLIAEKLSKQRVALAISATLGAAGMFLAMRYEVVEASQQGDTMGGLVAVLNTNFWLATHVTTVTMGYSAGLLAAVLGHVWIAMRLGRAMKAGGPELNTEDAGFYRAFSKIIYGVLCFGLLFSVVGTILGGVWANDSWGRFWGWDPKENGALMIVLFELVILHARMGGYIRDFGVAALSVATGAVVAFSWWHVNQLGVGLHSYGFTEGVLTSLYTYYGIVAVFLVVSLIGWSIFLRSRPRLEAA